MPCCIRCLGEGSNPLRKWSVKVDNFLELWGKQVEILDIQDLGFVATVFKDLWHRLTKVLFEQSFASPREVYQKTLNQVKEFIEAKRFVSRSIANPITSNQIE